MSLPIITLLALSLLASLAIYRYILHPALLSPLSHIPSAHWSAPFSRLWILYHRMREEETPTVHQAHQKLGPIVRIAPNEISVNCVDGGLRQIYAGGYEKGDWYSNIFSNYGVQPMFAMPEHGPHAKRKRMVSNVYAKTTLQTSSSLRSISDIILNDRLIPRIRELSQGGQPVEIYDIFAAVTLDFVSAYIFGLANSSNLLVQSGDVSQKFLRDFKARQRFQFWPQDLPVFTAFLGLVGLKWTIIPKWVGQANADIEAWLLRMCDGAESTLNTSTSGGEKDVDMKSENHPTVYTQLRTALLKDTTTKPSDHVPSDSRPSERQRLEIASEMLDHTLAGFDTSSVTLTFFAWELSRPANKHWQDQLRSELAGLDKAARHDPRALDTLPILHATLMETLRLHAAIPGNQPRITPPLATLGPNAHPLPPGVRVQSQAWSLHRNPDVFPSPDSWLPERWLHASAAESKEMARWFWAFGSGGRMCVGSNLAMFDMKAIIAAIWSGLETEVVQGEGMVHRGGYVAEPVGVDGQYCVLKVTEL